MNERIKLLTEQATIKTSHRYHTWGDRIATETKEVFDKEKFAELIVKECAELFVDQKYMILNPHEPFANERVRALKEHDKDTVRTIKKHFGVEE